MVRHVLIALAAAACLLLPTAAHAYDMPGFLMEENHFIKDGEELEQPTVKIIVSGTKYLVVPVTSGDTLITFMPMHVAEPKLEDRRSTNRKLFESADILRGYMLQKNNVSATPGVEWYVTGENARRADSLAVALAGEVSHMTAIEVEMASAPASAQIAELGTMIASMGARCAGLRSAINDALDFEAGLSSEAEAQEIYSLRGYFDEVYAQADMLEQEALIYSAELETLRLMISAAEGFDIDTKRSLLEMADPPSEFNDIGNWALDAEKLNGWIDSIYSVQVARTDAMLEDFESRIKMNNAHKVIYGPNTALSGLDPEFTSLANAAAIILNPENKPYWKNKDRLEALEDNWRLTENAYASGDYATALLHASKAESDVKAVRNAGLVDAQQPELLTPELITQMIIILIALLVIIYLYGNREKILALVGPRQEEEEVEINEWDRP